VLQVLCGDALDKLRTLPAASVQCCVTSPPYWGLRDYGVPGQIGLENSAEEYVANLVTVFAEVKRVLRDDGTLWLNLGDSYVSQPRGNREGDLSTSSLSNPERQDKLWGKHKYRSAMREPRIRAGLALKQKDLVGVPWMVAFALRGDGWWLRSDIIWAKTTCMPESVTDRPTRAHEYLFLLAKNAKYFYDSDAIKERAVESDLESRLGRANLNNKLLPTEQVNGIRPRVKYTPNAKDKQSGHGRRAAGFNERWDEAEGNGSASGLRNKRDVWTISPANYPEAHFATYPPALVKPCVLAGSRTGDCVLDPFGGSGTTAQVALELGRAAIVIEINPDYVKLIQTRCSVTCGLAL
jgi:DNA modification methylase